MARGSVSDSVVTIFLGKVWGAQNPRMLRGGSPREHAFADKALAHVLTDRNKHFADLIGADRARVSLSFVVSSHVALKDEPLSRSLQCEPE
jgi:hypothetical protein